MARAPHPSAEVARLATGKLRESNVTSAIIVAAGQGTRMGADKLFLEIAGLPIVGHTWKRIDAHPDIHEVVLVIRPECHSQFTALAEKLHPTKPYTLAYGGAERQDSVTNGLEATHPQSRLVVIQDGARPCTDAQTIADTISAANKQGAAVTATAVTDTLKLGDGKLRISLNVDRTNLWAVQTPQVFQKPIILEAMQAVRDCNATVTDDTAACELIGQPVTLVAASALNPKVTTPADMALVEFLLSQ